MIGVFGWRLAAADSDLENAMTIRVLLLGILYCFWQSPVAAQSEPPAPYVWSAQLPKPPAPTLNARHNGTGIAAGFYDYCVTTVGDNWCISLPSGYGTLYQPFGANASVRFSAGAQEPSCGWLMWRRGPYSSTDTPEDQRGQWKVGQPQNAGPWPMVSMPIHTHHGGDFQRYWNNGWRYQEAANFTKDGINGVWYRRTQAKGPLQFNGTRPDLPNPQPFAPDLTLLSAVSNTTAHQVAICWVDQFGRESELSDKLICAPLPGGTQTTVLEISKRYQPPQGAVAFRVYAGPFGNDGRGPLYRQPVLDRVGATKQYDWPLHLTRFYLHQIETNLLTPWHQGECRSWLNPIQQDIVSGSVVIHRPGKWRLYCPLILTYDPLKFGRKIGGTERTELAADFVASPAIIVCNQRDQATNLAVTANSCAAIATSDFSGGQAFSNQFHGCNFTNLGMDGYGVLVDECASYTFSQHTASEMLFRNCQFSAARPVKLEGNQTAKMRFDDRCAFNCNGKSRYLNEVCALQIFTPNAVVFDVIEGVNGLNNFRSFVGVYNNAGTPLVRISDVFIDRGCAVGFAFGPNTGGTLELTKGDKIGVYSQDRSWFRLAEAPNSNNSRLTIRGLQFPDKSSILSYNLNQLAIDLDRPIAEIVTPSESDWTARGLYLSFGGKDWQIKQNLSGYSFGSSSTADSLPRTSPSISPTGN